MYQRSKPMVLSLPNPLGYVQVMTGTSGQSIREFEPAISAWSEKHFVGLGFSKYTISPGKIVSQYFDTPPISSDDRSCVQHENVEAYDWPSIYAHTLARKLSTRANGGFVQISP